MARSFDIGKNQWKQPLKDRVKSFTGYNIPADVKDFCSVEINTKRLMHIMFDTGVCLGPKVFTISSGFELQLNSEDQIIAETQKLKHGSEWFMVDILDVDVKTDVADEADYASEMPLPQMEGRVTQVTVRQFERSASIVRQKKASANSLACEICGIDFSKTYENGEGFIECHHIHPIALSKGERSTTLDDLILICPNCHRMAHRHINQWLRENDPEDMPNMGAKYLRKRILVR